VRNNRIHSLIDLIQINRANFATHIIVMRRDPDPPEADRITSQIREQKE